MSDFKPKTPKQIFQYCYAEESTCHNTIDMVNYIINNNIKGDIIECGVGGGGQIALIRQSELGSFNEGGSDREGFVAHRHDQAVMSVIFKRYKVKMYDYGYITTASHCFEPFEYGNHSYIYHLSI